MNANELVKVYIKIRDKKDTIKRAADEQVSQLNEELSIVEEALREQLKTSGADSIKTPNGTAFVTIKSRYWTDNWEKFYGFVQDQEAFELLEKRIHQGNMKSFIEENPEAVPEGLNVESKMGVTVRRK